MLINAQALRAGFIGFQAAFQGGFAGAGDDWRQVAMQTNSTTSKEEYGWLGELPQIREWIGDRVIHGLNAHDYSIKNKPWELTVGVNKDHFEDDRLGIYTPLFGKMGQDTARFPNRLVFDQLKAGFSTLCYDGQYFFDTDHPVLAADGTTVSVSNTGGGSGTPWFLLCTNEFIKPIIFQQRRAFDFVRMDAPTDEVVFNRKEYRYGVDGRCNVGFGLWQLAYGSRQTLDATSYAAARTALGEMKGDGGRPLGLKPNLLVVPPSLAGAGRTILKAEQISGTTNIWNGTADLMEVPWLA